MCLLLQMLILLSLYELECLFPPPSLPLSILNLLSSHVLFNPFLIGLVSLQLLLLLLSLFTINFFLVLFFPILLSKISVKDELTDLVHLVVHLAIQLRVVWNLNLSFGPHFHFIHLPLVHIVQLPVKCNLAIFNNYFSSWFAAVRPNRFDFIQHVLIPNHKPNYCVPSVELLHLIVGDVELRIVHIPVLLARRHHAQTVGWLVAAFPGSFILDVLSGDRGSSGPVVLRDVSCHQSLSLLVEVDPGSVIGQDFAVFVLIDSLADSCKVPGVHRGSLEFSFPPDLFLLGLAIDLELKVPKVTYTIHGHRVVPNRIEVEGADHLVHVDFGWFLI